VNILVAGASGFLGSTLVPLLARRHTVHALARRPRASADNVYWHQVDLAARPDTWQLPATWDVAVFLAQSSGYREFPARAADMVAVNVDAPTALLDRSRRQGAHRFVLASTANVYRVSHTRINEQSAIAPTSFYARTRRAAELLAEPFADHVAVTVARIFTVYGPGQRRDTLIANVIERVVNGDAVQVQGERGLLLSPLYLSDAVDALARLVEAPRSSGGFTVVNIAGTEGVGIRELAAAVGAVTGRPPVIDPLPGSEPGGWVGDTGLLTTMTGWSPAITLAEGLARTVSARE
jgi:nucleoside-diphosphate-sugar epimerase